MKIFLNTGEPSSKLKYFVISDSEQYREGMVKKKPVKE